jgi:hypothetical protein
MRYIILLLALIMVGCIDTDRLNVRPSKTSVTYGSTVTTNDTAKDAKNDSTTTSDSDKRSWTIKQEFVWH